MNDATIHDGKVSRSLRESATTRSVRKGVRFRPVARDPKGASVPAYVTQPACALLHPWGDVIDWGGMNCALIVPLNSDGTPGLLSSQNGRTGRG